jgi:nitrite reductase/ring-hydroxylating ferredoxin subunit/uncharacterized membrane protein
MDYPPLESVAEPLSTAVRDAFESGGETGHQIKNALHGVWLGHPLHPVFTDLPLGAWTTALALDASANGNRDLRRAATFAMGVGLAGAAGAAVTGLTDWSETDGKPRREGLIHGLLNIAATTLMTAAFVARQRTSHRGGRWLAWTGYAFAIGAAYVGGDLVYDQRIGVTHATTAEPERFTPVARRSSLHENSMKRARKGDLDVLLVRQHGKVCALAHSCAHLGGPLSEGTLKNGSVVCPWHGSEFGLEDGHVISGPATEPQPCFAVRERGASIEVKR